MSPKPSLQPLKSPAVKESAGGSQIRARRKAPLLHADDDPVASLPPLPSDPVALAELRQRLEEGLAAVQAGEGEDWQAVHARVRARLNLSPL